MICYGHYFYFYFCPTFICFYSFFLLEFHIRFSENRKYIILKPISIIKSLHSHSEQNCCHKSNHTKRHSRSPYVQRFEFQGNPESNSAGFCDYRNGMNRLKEPISSGFSQWILMLANLIFHFAPFFILFFFHHE